MVITYLYMQRLLNCWTVPFLLFVVNSCYFLSLGSTVYTLVNSLAPQPSWSPSTACEVVTLHSSPSICEEKLCRAKYALAFSTHCRNQKPYKPTMDNAFHSAPSVARS